MWIANTGRSNWVVGERTLPAKTYLEVTYDDEWAQFFANPTIASRVRSGELLVDTDPPPDDILWYTVESRRAAVQPVGICVACHAPIDTTTGRFTGEIGGSGGNEWTLYLSGDGTPADVSYSPPDTLVIDRR